MSKHLKGTSSARLLRYAFVLSIITIVYNLIEGAVSTIFGATDRTLVLFGFGIDSFAEVLSGIGIAHMIFRMKTSEIATRDDFEVRSLQITGIALYLLALGILVGAFFAIFQNYQPESTTAGIIISMISILTMFFLYREKIKTGEKLNSKPIISDAKCTKTCFYLSFIVLISSLLYQFFQIRYVDALGSLGIAWYAWKEGKEAFENARSRKLSCSGDCC